jgi:signal peptidase I
VSGFEPRPPGTSEGAEPSPGDGGVAMGTADPYEILGVPRDASQEDIRAAYERFAKYPDLWVGSGPDRAERLSRIEAAYRLLSDPARRSAYDQAIAQGAQPRHEPARRRRSWNPVDRMTRNLPRQWRIAIDWAVTIVGAILIVLALKQWIVNPYRIPSSSMEPTLHCARSAGSPGCEAHFSDRVLACRICLDFTSPSRGDIIVFKTPPEAAQKCGAGGTFVKRLIGLPGEVVTEKNGHVFVDGKPLKETYIEKDRRDSRTGKWRVPNGDYFFMGDNRAQSCDSREWGSVPRGNLIGEVFFVYWPPNRIGFR